MNTGIMCSASLQILLYYFHFIAVLIHLRNLNHSFQINIFLTKIVIDIY